MADYQTALYAMTPLRTPLMFRERSNTLPTISMFYGIIVSMYFYDNRKHTIPHIHAEYAEYVASVAIEDGEVLSGQLPTKKQKLVQAWIEIHKEALLANWKLAVAGEPVFGIEPLR